MARGNQIKLNGKTTLKETKFAQTIVKQVVENKGINGTEAALQVYDTTDRKTAGVIATENLKKASVRELVEQGLKAGGLDIATLMGEFSSLAQKKVEKISGDVKLRTMMEAAKLLGLYPDKRSAHVNLNISGKIKDMKFQEAQKELQKLRGETDIFQEEVK